MNLTELLKINPEIHKTVSVVGGGGKTSLIFALAEELIGRGYRVIVTTTTHMAYEPERPFSKDGETGQIRENLKHYGYTVAGALEYKNDSTDKKVKAVKISSLSPEQLRTLSNECDILLIEADGAKFLPLKVPEAWEPVIPDFTDIVIGVTGLDSLGQPIGKTAHRAEKTAAFLNKTTEDIVTPDDLVKIASSENGLRKNAGKMAYRVYFNKADVLSDQDLAAEICKRLAGQQIYAVWGSLKDRGKAINREHSKNEKTGI